MKKQTLVLLAAVISLTGSALAQPGRGMGGSPGLNAVMTKLFGENKEFSADIEIDGMGAQGQSMDIPGKIYFDSGKTRFEVNLSDAKGSQMNPAMMQQMKTMGMDKTEVITRPDAKLTYLIYPGLNAYVENPLRDPNADKPDSAFKIDTTELGKETVDGHACVKNKVVVTDDQGQKHEMTVWNATDLKKFPVKIESDENGRNTTMTFSNIKMAKPDAALFEPPTDYKKYANQRELMQQEVMKRMGMPGMPGMAPGGAPPAGAQPGHP